MSGASERANGQGSGPVLSSGFLVILDHFRKKSLHYLRIEPVIQDVVRGLRLPVTSDAVDFDFDERIDDFSFATALLVLQRFRQLTSTNGRNFICFNLHSVISNVF